jgi:hypothetical protein
MSSFAPLNLYTFAAARGEFLRPDVRALLQGLVAPLVAMLDDVHHPQFPAEPARDVRLVVVLKAERRELFGNMVVAVLVDVVDLDGLARLVAYATDAIVLVKHFGRDLVWNLVRT